MDTQGNIRKLDVAVNQSILLVLGRKLYSSDFFYVCLREAIQNSLDAKAKNIIIETGNNTIKITDDGTGIEKIEGLLNVIGESVKSNDQDTIGGYGLAKLALFSCKEWQFKSISGSFKTGFLYDLDDKLDSGTEVTLSFSEEDYPYRVDTKIANFVSLINRNVTFMINENIVELPEYKTISYSTYEDKIVSGNSLYSSDVVVRLNGMPSFTRYTSNLDGKTVIYDYYTHARPYDDDYPLTSNRDSFLPHSSENDDLKDRHNSLVEKLETDKIVEQSIKKNERQLNWRNNKYYALGEITKAHFEEYSKIIVTYERYLKSIDQFSGNNIFNGDKIYCFGLTDGKDNELGCYDTKQNIFYIEAKNFNKGMILSIALHEYIHAIGYDYHNESFLSALASVTGKVINAILIGEFRK